MPAKKVHEDEGAELMKYELGYHLVPSLGPDDLALRVGELEKLIEKAGGAVYVKGAPQPFILAYTMRRLRGGAWEAYDTSFFGWMRFTALPERMPELKASLAQSQWIVRSLTFSLDGSEEDTPKLFRPQPVTLEPTTITKREVKEEKVEVSEEVLEKQIEEMIT